MSPSPTTRTTDCSRREVLSIIGVIASTPLSGCGDLVVSSGSEGEGDTIESMVGNRTDEPAAMGVRVEDDDGTMLFSRVYELEADHLDSSAGTDATPRTVTAFTPEGVSATWEYTPDPDVGRDGEDIGITRRSDGSIDSWYACCVRPLHRPEVDTRP